MMYDVWEKSALRAALRALGRNAYGVPREAPMLEARGDAYTVLRRHLEAVDLHPELPVMVCAWDPYHTDYQSAHGLMVCGSCERPMIAPDHPGGPAVMEDGTLVPLHDAEPGSGTAALLCTGCDAPVKHKHRRWGCCGSWKCCPLAWKKQQEVVK